MKSLSIGRPVFTAMLAHLKSVYPQEGCGLLSGVDGRIDQNYPIHNHLQSPFAFEMEPTQLIAAFMAFEAQQQTLLAIYHSHPQGPALPSTIDIQQAHYPEAVQIIVSFENPDDPKAQALEIIDGRVSNVTLTFV